MAIVYLNGEFVQLAEAKVSVLDRGFLFGDGAYEVIPIYHGKPFRMPEHLARLQHSLNAIKIMHRFAWNEIELSLLELLQRNAIEAGDHLLYVQVTRGVDIERNFAINADLVPTVLALTKKIAPISFEELRRGKSAITLEDTRWKHCAIKSISLLPSVLLYHEVFSSGCNEGILIRDGYALEGVSSNIFIVKQGNIITPPLSENNLSGVTRDLLLKLLQENGISYKEQKITYSELVCADEIWISSSTRGLMPITKLNNEAVGNGLAGPMWEQVAKIYLTFRDELNVKQKEI